MNTANNKKRFNPILKAAIYGACVPPIEKLCEQIANIVVHFWDIKNAIDDTFFGIELLVFGPAICVVGFWEDDPGEIVVFVLSMVWMAAVFALLVGLWRNICRELKNIKAS